MTRFGCQNVKKLCIPRLLSYTIPIGLFFAPPPPPRLSSWPGVWFHSERQKERLLMALFFLSFPDLTWARRRSAEMNCSILLSSPADFSDWNHHRERQKERSIAFAAKLARWIDVNLVAVSFSFCVLSSLVLVLLFIILFV